MKSLAVTAVLVAATLAGACSRRVVVGVVLPETGSAAVYGASLKSGIKLAFDVAVANGTLPGRIVTEYRDSESDPSRAASLAEALFDAGALVIIGGATSGEAKAMIPEADRRARVLVSPSASAPELARQSIYFFRLYPSDDLEGVKAADLLAVTRQARMVMIIREDSAYTRGLLPVFVGELRHQGGQVVETVSMEETSWQRRVREVVDSRGPEGVFLAGYGEAILEGLQLLRSIGYRGTICTTSAINTAAFLQKAGARAEGVFFPLAALDVRSQQEPVRSFVRRYREAYSMTPDIYAAHGYDAALAVILALSDPRARSGSDVRLRLQTLSEQQGVTGPLAFDDFGNIKHYLRVHWVRGGRVEDYDAQVEREQERRRDEVLALPQGRGD